MVGTPCQGLFTISNLWIHRLSANRDLRSGLGAMKTISGNHNHRVNGMTNELAGILSASRNATEIFDIGLVGEESQKLQI